MNVDFIFDFASPNAYLCHKAIQNLEKTHDINFNYVPCSKKFDVGPGTYGEINYG